MSREGTLACSEVLTEFEGRHLHKMGSKAPVSSQGDAAPGERHVNQAAFDAVTIQAAAGNCTAPCGLL
jgi:hypothetical protein